jgi:hypothetical protein
MNDKCETKRNITTSQLVFVWGLSLVLSCSAVGMSGYTLTRDVISRTCEDHGHSFEPRYNTEPPNPELVTSLGIVGTTATLEAVTQMSKKIYVGDVCAYCGKTAAKPEAK